MEKRAPHGSRESLYGIRGPAARRPRCPLEADPVPKIDHTQLFDLRSDPYELHDLASDSAYAPEKARLMSMLRTWQRRAEDPHPLTAEAVNPMEFDFGRVRREPDRHQPAIIREKYFRED